jgi:CheY-like chemotaxis protein
MKPLTPTLLYIDDDAGLARLVDRGLTRAGFKVVHAASGEAGLARLAQGGIDVVALDQFMPGLDGLETLERIMAVAGAPPVVFVTAAMRRSPPNAKCCCARSTTASAIPCRSSLRCCICRPIRPPRTTSRRR